MTLIFTNPEGSQAAYSTRANSSPASSPRQPVLEYWDLWETGYSADDRILERAYQRGSDTDSSSDHPLFRVPICDPEPTQRPALLAIGPSIEQQGVISEARRIVMDAASTATEDVALLAPDTETLISWYRTTFSEATVRAGRELLEAYKAAYSAGEAEILRRVRITGDAAAETRMRAELEVAALEKGREAAYAAANSAALDTVMDWAES